MRTRDFIVAGIFAMLFMTVAVTTAQPTSGKDAKQVTLVIDYGDGVQKHFTSIAWKQGLTVLEGLKSAQQHPRGIRFEQKGSGAAAFLTKIDDLSNEGRGRNWMFRVNGKRAEMSFGSQELAERDSVLWKFE